MLQKVLNPLYPVSKYVDSIYYTHGIANGISQTLIPDGKTDLLLNFDSSVNIISNNHKTVISKSIFQGIRKKLYTFEFSEKINIVGIRFHPFGFSSLFKIPEIAIGENPVGADLIDNASISEIEEKVYLEENADEKLKLVEYWILHLIIKNNHPVISLANTLAEIKNSKGISKIQSLNESGSSYKKIQRTFRNSIGISPKLYARMLRFEQIHNELRFAKNVDWFAFVAKYQFHDQSHLIKEFKYFSGVTPNEFLLKINTFL